MCIALHRLQKLAQTVMFVYSLVQTNLKDSICSYYNCLLLRIVIQKVPMIMWL